MTKILKSLYSDVSEKFSVAYTDSLEREESRFVEHFIGPTVAPLRLTLDQLFCRLSARELLRRIVSQSVVVHRLSPQFVETCKIHDESPDQQAFALRRKHLALYFAKHRGSACTEKIVPYTIKEQRIRTGIGGK